MQSGTYGRHSGDERQWQQQNQAENAFIVLIRAFVTAGLELNSVLVFNGD